MDTLVVREKLRRHENQTLASWFTDSGEIDCERLGSSDRSVERHALAQGCSVCKAKASASEPAAHQIAAAELYRRHRFAKRQLKLTLRLLFE